MVTPLAEYTIAFPESRTVLSIINTRILQFQGVCIGHNKTQLLRSKPVEQCIHRPCTRLPNRSLSASVGGARGIRSFRSAESGVLVVPFARTAAMQNRAFSVVGPRVWNDLPQKLRIFPRL